MRTLGPGISQRDQSFVIPNQTGDMKLEANFEYRFDIVWKIAGAGFIDVGNVWTLNDKTSNEESMFKWRRFGESLLFYCLHPHDGRRLCLHVGLESD